MTALFAALHTLSFVVSDRMAAVKEEKGASMVEYALLVGAIATILITLTATFGEEIQTEFNNILP
jgi:pilus assembly protein Flp/PilA